MGHRQSGVQQVKQQGPFIAAAGLDHDRGQRQALEALDQFIPPAGGVGDGEGLLGVVDAHVELLLGDIDAHATNIR